MQQPLKTQKYHVLRIARGRIEHDYSEDVPQAINMAGRIQTKLFDAAGKLVDQIKLEVGPKFAPPSLRASVNIYGWLLEQGVPASELNAPGAYKKWNIIWIDQMISDL